MQLYVSDFERPFTERVTDAFSDPVQAAVTCVKTGPIKLTDVDDSPEGEEVFAKSRSMAFKSARRGIRTPSLPIWSEVPATT